MNCNCYTCCKNTGCSEPLRGKVAFSVSSVMIYGLVRRMCSVSIGDGRAVQSRTHQEDIKHLHQLSSYEFLKSKS